MRLSLCATAATAGFTVHPQDCTGVNVEFRWNDTDKENMDDRKENL
jgi:hypothetical protein